MGANFTFRHAGHGTTLAATIVREERPDDGDESPDAGHGPGLKPCSVGASLEAQWSMRSWTPERGPRLPTRRSCQVNYRLPAGPIYHRHVTGAAQEALDLVLIRHGQSAWNAENRFTGWVDVDLTAEGEEEARAGGRLLAEAASSELPGNTLDLRILHTSVLTRAIRTAELALAAAGRSWLPVRRDWRLNERHYGDLQGKNKAQIKQQFGEEQFMLWRRSYDTPPPELAPDNPYDVSGDPRYEGMEDEVPRTECLADVVRRVEPYLEQMILPDLRAVAQWGGAVLVVAHGNSIRALRKVLEDISDDDIAGLEIPTGIPYRMLLEEDASVRSAGYLGDPEAAAAAAAAVARQGDRPPA